MHCDNCMWLSDFGAGKPSCEIHSTSMISCSVVWATGECITIGGALLQVWPPYPSHKYCMLSATNEASLDAPKSRSFMLITCQLQVFVLSLLHSVLRSHHQWLRNEPGLTEMKHEYYAMATSQNSLVSFIGNPAFSSWTARRRSLCKTRNRMILIWYQVNNWTKQKHDWPKAGWKKHAEMRPKGMINCTVYG